MILATGMRIILWTMVVTVVAVESHLVLAGVAGNCDYTVNLLILVLLGSIS